MTNGSQLAARHRGAAAAYLGDVGTCSAIPAHVGSMSFFWSMARQRCRVRRTGYPDEQTGYLGQEVVYRFCELMRRSPQRHAREPDISVKPAVLRVSPLGRDKNGATDM
jgi:hypothetical protein